MSEWDVGVRAIRAGGRPVLTVTGEIDLAVAGRFAQELESLVAGHRRNRARSTSPASSFIDSSGIRELLKAKRATRGAGGDLLLLRPSDFCRRVLEISGVWSDFTVLEASS